MTAEEIRAEQILYSPTYTVEQSIGYAIFGTLREIAAQLAELNERLSSGSVWANIKDRSFDEDRPVGAR